MGEETKTEEKRKKLEDIRKEAEEKACPVQKTLYFIDEFIAGPMCSKCYPCSLGTGDAKIRLTRISSHHKNVSKKDFQALKRIGLNMIEGSFCKKGRDTGRFLIEILAASEDEFIRHISGFCLQKECISLVEYRIDPGLCVMCGECLAACKHEAIIGEKRESYLTGYLPFEILQKKCTKCGECVQVCQIRAIGKLSSELPELIAK
jgi:ferredoxin